MRKDINIIVILSVIAVIIFIGLGFMGFKGFTGEMNALSLSSAQGIMDELQQTGTVSELRVADIVAGGGEAVASGDAVLVHYTGMFPNGTIFDSSARHGRPVPFLIGVGQVIPGWDQGIIGMKEGGRRLLAVPPHLAYGEAGREGIPPNSTLVFEVELLQRVPASEIVIEGAPAE